MELGGGGGGGGGSSSSCYYPSLGRAAAAVGGSPAAGRVLAEAAAGTDLSTAAASWRKGFPEGAPPRGLSRRSLNAFVPCTNLKVLLERDLSKERHELLKDQRLFRNRARKHFIETNKRRRALEEKWKEDEEKEQKFREQILLQRKLKHQEATERFQRSHLVSSQRKKGGVQRKPENKLDEPQKSQVSGLSSSRVIGSSIETDSSTTRNGPFHLKKNSAKPVCDRTLQAKNRTNLGKDQIFQQNLDEMQQQLQEQHFSNLQDFHQEVNEIARSGSVCSVDSLEAKEPNGNCTVPCKTSSLSTQSSVQHSEGSKSKNKHLSAEHDTFSKNQHMNNWLLNVNTSDIQKTSPFRDILIKYNVVPSDENTCNPDLKSSVPTSSEQGESERCVSDGNLTFVQNKTEDKSFLLKCPSSNIISTGDPLAADRPVVKLNKAWTVPDHPPAVSEQDHFELSQNNKSSSAQTCGSNVVFSNQQWNVTSYCSNSFLLNCMQKGKDIHAARCTEDTDCVAEVKDEKSFDHANVEAPTFEEPSDGSTDQHKGNGEGKETEIILPVPQADVATNLSDLDQQKNDNICEKKVLKLPKSILKKESKYELGYFKAMVVNKGIRFGHQPVASARDSVELAKIKGKDGDVQKNCKKLRWFDEINRVVEANDDGKVSEPSISEITQAQPQTPGSQIKVTASKANIRSIPSCLLNSVFPDNNLENSQTSAKPGTVGNSGRDNAIHSVFVSKGYHIAKQAWMAPRSEEIIPLIYNCDPKNSKINPRKGRTKMIKRPKSAKVPSSTVLAKNRKGALNRPQSASEATKVIRAPGKVIVPHPPCKPIIQSKRPDENPTESVCQLSNLSKPPTDAENSQSDKNLLPESQSSGRCYMEDPSTSGSSCHSQIATIRPSYSIYTYAPLTKAKCIMNTIPPVTHGTSISRRSPVFSENGLCPDRTPTDEEITILWQGVHRALVQRNGAAGDSQHYTSLCSNSNNGDLQHTRSNVSHITIDGGNLMSNMKSGVRVNPIVSSQPSAHFAFARRKINENNENKRKALLEQRRQMSGSSGRKPTSAGQNISQATMQAHSQCMFEPVRVTGGVSNSDEDSTAQFLIAENLVNLSGAEGEILAGLDTSQPYRQIAVRNRPPRQGMSTLSFEEHKVLQSLDRINHRLQNAHETINKNPSSTSVLQTISPLVTSPSYMDIMPHLQRYRSILDATHSLKQRRY